MEREIASFDIYVIVSELQDFIGGYIDKIYQPSRDEILLRIKNPKSGEKESIYIRNNELVCRTQKQFNALIKPPSFSMTLRKHLLNGRIQAITQHEFDRIITIAINKKEESFQLVVELFKNGNVILVDSQGIIIHSLLTQRWAQRTIRPHETYHPPPTQKNPFTMDHDMFVELLKNSKRDLVRTLVATLNLGGTYAEELCVRANVDKNLDAKSLDSESTENLYKSLVSLLDLFRSKKYNPVYVKQGEEFVDLFPFPFQSISGTELIPVKSFSQGFEVFIQKKKTPKQKKGDEQQKHIEKLQRQLQQQMQSVEEFTGLIRQKQQEGDLIYLHLQSIQALLDEIGVVLKEKEKNDSIQRVNQNPLVKTFDPLSNVLVVNLQNMKGDFIDIPLDFRKSAVDNAQQAYEDGKKYKEKIDGAEIAIRDTKSAIEDMQRRVVVESQQVESVSVNLQKRFWFEPYRWCLSSEGNIFVAGRDAKSNDVVVKKYLKDGDRYVHADIHGAPSCIVKNKGVFDEALSISEKTLEEACIFATSFSKAWKQFGEAQAYWVLPEQVSKTPQSGEFLPKGAFVIRGKRNYYRCTLELAVGEVLVDGARKIMSGPVRAVESRSERFVVVQSGTVKTSSLAKVLSRVFGVSSDDVLKVMPPGEVRVVKTVGLELPDLV